MKIMATAFEMEIDGDYRPVDGLAVICDACGSKVEVYGTTDASEQRAAAMLREGCPRGEANFYVIVRAPDLLDWSD